MYSRPDDRVEGDGTATELLRAAPFVQLVSAGQEGLLATGLPMLVDDDGYRLVGHLARANRHWRTLDGAEVLVIASVSDAYVSPSWYPSKREDDGRVVPTWNYEVVHVHGIARVHDDRAWLLDLIDRLSDVHEASRTDGGERWAVADAPAGFVDQLVGAIVGVSVEIGRIDAKQKLGGNRSEADQRGVLEALRRTEHTPARMLHAMEDALKSRSAST